MKRSLCEVIQDTKVKASNLITFSAALLHGIGDDSRRDFVVIVHSNRPNVGSSTAQVVNSTSYSVSFYVLPVVFCDSTGRQFIGINAGM